MGVRRSGQTEFMADGGSMGATRLAHDWSTSPLGNPERWLADSLVALGYHAVVMQDGASALAALDRVNPDAMIVDFAMPGMNGAELARRASQRRPDLPILFASGYSETAVVEAAMGERARLLHKPFKVHELRSALHELLAVPANG